MEDKIEVGEYVRSKDGIIAKLVDLICGQDACFDNEIICKSFDMTLSDFELNHIDIFSKAFSEVIVKHSKNIIELIGVKDIVIITSEEHGTEFYYIWDRGMLEAIKRDIAKGAKILSIVTKEQFESMKYEINEEEN